MATVAETIAQSLHEAGVRLVFGMPGGEVVSVLEALQRVGIGFELMHHEQSAVFFFPRMGMPGQQVSQVVYSRRWVRVR